MIIVAFGHRQRVGKDTAAKFMLNHLRLNSVKCARLSFGDIVKAEAAKLFKWAGMRDAVYYNNNPIQIDKQITILGKTPRQVWLELGYYLSQMHPATICENALAHCDADVLVCSDLRRPIETDYVKKFRGVLIKIERDVPKVESLYHGHPAYMMDSSLDDYQGWDHVISNNGSLRDFADIVVALSNQLLERLK